MSYSADLWDDVVEVVDEQTDEVVAGFSASGKSLKEVRSKLIELFGAFGRDMPITDLRGS